MKLLSYRKDGIYCIPGDFYIDPWHSVHRAVITHAHADHARGGMKSYLCHDFTSELLRVRLGNDIVVESLPYGKSLDINGVKVSLHPAGHVIGSAQVRMEYQGYVAVVSGDYKVMDDGITTPFELVKCHEFVTESTFGLPVYNWITDAEARDQIHRWVYRNIEQKRTSVFTAYSLGKAQRLMKLLDGLAPVWVHPAIEKLNNAIERAGVKLPEVKVLPTDQMMEKAEGQIVIIPPASLGPDVVKKIPRAVVAICSGWTQIRGHRRWQSADAGFPISDHADWCGLINTCKATGAEKIMVTHGQTETFARYLNEIGLFAEVVKTKFGEEGDFD